MLDIGTRPDKHAVFKLYKYMLKHNNCGGCCGEIEVDFSNDKGINSSYFVKAAQFYEYKMGHSPDKACESFFGFNSVLPGAYSVFRWKAIKGEPLDEFFRSVTREDFPSCAEANEFLAEDRVMCLQIYIKKNCKYHLAYIPDCKAFTDAPDSLAVLIKQRRRWMNGAMFGTVKVISNFVHMVSCKRTKHSWYRSVMMTVFLIYYTTTFLF
jgi:chitin synthase